MAIIGLYDLSISYGVPGKFDHPLIEQAADKIIRACKNYGVAPGTYASSIESAEYWIKRGMRCMECYTDLNIYVSALGTLATRLKQGQNAKPRV